MFYIFDIIVQLSKHYPTKVKLESSPWKSFDLFNYSNQGNLIKQECKSANYRLP